ncbi:MAG TPA: hypothetical protein VMJ92_05890, partial [Candidatus Limnocylindrales bacterium]|nr:hypothetical protein [Candidatus Limnocylindrales bacterium]
ARTVAEETRVFRTSLERIDLATGERRSVDAGTVEYAGVLAIGDHEGRTEDMSEEEVERRLLSYAEQVARSYGQVVTSPDASNVLLIRPRAGTSTVRVDRYDGRSLEHLGTRTWTGAASPERFFPLDGSGFLAVSYEHPDIFSRRDTWTFLDRELREVATVTGATDVDWPNYCAGDLQALPDGRTWVTICDRHERTYFLQLIDRERLTDAGKVELTGGVRYPAAILAWDVAADGTINVLTDRPSLIRVDPVARRVTDHRLITSSEAPRQAGPIESKPSPRIQFSADGRLVYVAHLGFDGRLGGAPLSLIDVASGHVVATLEGGGVTGLKLSADGARLYVIRDGRLVLLDPGTLRVVSATEPIVTPPGSLLIVAPRD